MLYGGSILPGRFRGHDVTIQDVFEAVGAHAAGKMSDEDLSELEHAACPGAGACGGQFTANTMATAFEVMGISPMGTAMVPAMDPRKDEVCVEAGKLVMRLLEQDLKPSDVITRGSLENAIAAVAATGGSTNGVLHLLAVAYEAGIDLELEDFDRISSRTPLLADLKPGGRFVAADLYRAGGVGAGGQAAPRSRRAERGRAHGHRPHDRRGGARGRGGAGAGGRAPAGQPAEGNRRPRDPARQPRPGGLRREGGRATSA